MRKKGSVKIIFALLVLMAGIVLEGLALADYQNVYGLTRARIKVHTEATVESPVFDNLQSDRLVYVFGSLENSGVTFIQIRYRTVEGELQTGWIAQSEGETVYVQPMSLEDALRIYGVSNGNVPRTAAGMRYASERAALGGVADGGNPPMISVSGLSPEAQSIAEAQTILKALGRYNGDITGNAGAKTVAAISDFQAQYGLTADGVPGAATLAKLYEVYQAAVNGTGSISTGTAQDADSVREAQTILKALGYYNGDITGNAGEKTQAAIRSFQRQYGLTEDGVAGSNTLAKLYEVYQGAASSNTAAAETDTDSIMTAQAILKELGLYNGDITGNAGEKTQAAIRAFQQQYGLTVDGIVGQKTLSKLYEVYQGASSVSASGEEQNNAEADVIREAQTILKELGIYSGDVTGNAGEKTQAAIRAFQKQYGLTVDGVVGQKTLSKLYEVYQAAVSGASVSTADSSTQNAAIIQEAQAILKELGLYSGDITGNAGAKTQAAIKAFQQQNGLTADGIVGTSTLEAMRNAYSSLQSGTAGTASAGTMTEGTIREVQTMLKELGLYNGEITGNAGNKTTEAIRTFQQWYGLSADGVAGAKTLARMREVYQQTAASAVSTETSSGSMSADTVRMVQTMLKDMNLYTGEITGNAGEKTISAIKSFQRKYGLTEDGVAGNQTLSKMQEVYNSLFASSTGTTSSSAEAEVAAVEEAQTILKALGLYNGEITGNLGNKTKAAIQSFQTQYGLTADGVPGNKTLAKMREVYASLTNAQTAQTGSNLSGMSTDTIMEVQVMLNDMGLYQGEITGNAGNKTIAAIKAFQQKYGLTVDGNAGRETLSKMREVYNAQLKGTTVSADAGKSMDEATVREVQTILGALGIYSGEVTGNAGGKTVSAIKAFQQKYGLTADGVAGTQTLAKMREVYSSSLRSSSSSTASTDTKNQSMSTSTVREVQTMLGALGIYSGEVTGNAGDKTISAIKAFQQKYGLTADGVAGTQTLTKMREVYAGRSSGSSSTSSSSAARTSGKIYNLDWFNAKENGVFGRIGFSKGRICKLTDLTNNITMDIFIQSASYHLDVEPLTASDTQKLCKMYKVSKPEKIGAARHPALLETEHGYKFLCSIYAQPHGFQEIHSNNFEGQFCIHFLNSKTHGSDVVDNGHQEAIRKAKGIVGSGKVTTLKDPSQLRY